MIGRLFILIVLFPGCVLADSRVWTFRPGLLMDDWGKPISPPTISVGKRSVELRMVPVAAGLFEKLKIKAASSDSKRLVKRTIVSHLKTDADVTHAKKYLLPDSGSAAADVFQLGVGYIDKFGLVGILQSVAKWECSADEKCPERVVQKLENLLTKEGKIVRTDTFIQIDGRPRFLTTITYEVADGYETRVVPLRSHLLEILVF